MFQTKEHDTTLEIDLKEMAINDLPDKDTKNKILRIAVTIIIC